MLRTACFLLFAVSMLAEAASAATYRVDDTGTVVSQPVTPMRWRQLAPSRAGDNTAEGRLNVALRLNLANWLRRPVRIYMILAPTSTGIDQLTATWRSQGRLLPGSLRAGGRALVFDGIVTESFLMETIELTLTADGRTLERPQTLQFSFEIEVLQ